MGKTFLNLDLGGASRPNSVFKAECRLQGRIYSLRSNFVLAAEFRLEGRFSASGPIFVLRIFVFTSSSGPNILLFSWGQRTVRILTLGIARLLPFWRASSRRKRPVSIVTLEIPSARTIVAVLGPVVIEENVQSKAITRFLSYCQ